MPRVETEHRAVVDMPAVQARMLLRDQSFLDPTKTTEAPLLKNDTVAQFAERSYGLFEEASLRERRSLSNQAETHAIQYQRWSEGVSTCFSAEVNKGKMDTLKPLLAKIGIVHPQMEKVDIQRLYDRYFNSTLSSSGIKAFVKDVLDTYKIEGKVDLAAIERDRESIQWMSELFGGTSSEMISQLIASEAKLLADPHCFETLNKTIQAVTESEKKMMGFIYDKKIIETTRVVERGKLPIEAYEEEIKRAVLDENNDNIIISAGTGAGKTTKVPQYIYKILKPGERVAVTQPRRLPTESLAGRVAKEMGVTLGREVGYSHGKGRKVSKDTRLLFTVEKSLLIQLAEDPYLTKYNYVMVDEWHERHKDTDMLVSLLQRAQELRRQKGGMPPLKMIITSATMDREDLQQQLGSKTESFEVPGRAYQITSKFEPKGSTAMSRDLAPLRAARATLEMVRSQPANRNILIFMPGDGLISQTYEEIKKLKLPPNVVVDKLIGTMTREEQERAIDVSDGKKHIIVSSPIAETSLTLERADVISSGLVNVPRVDPQTGLYFLEEIPHSKKGLEQQKGRTGRESDGTWQFLGTEEEYENLIDHHPAEILRTDISDEILLLKKIGLTFDEIQLIDKDKISQLNIARAQRRLKDLGAITASGEITEIGRQMVNIPLDIHYSRMLVEAEKRGCLKDAVTLAVVCSQNDLYQRGEDEDKQAQLDAQREFEYPNGSDFLARLRMYKKFEEVGQDQTDPVKREEERKQWAAAHYLRYATLERIEAERTDLLERLNYRKPAPPETTDEAALSRCVFEGFRDNLLTRGSYYIDKKSHKKLYSYSLRGEDVHNGVIDRNSTVTPDNSSYVVTAGNYARQTGEKRYIFMQMNQVVDPTWL